MKRLHSFIIIYVISSSVTLLAQDFSPTHIATSVNSLYELEKLEEKYIGLKLTAINDSIVEEFVEIYDLKKFKKDPKISSLVKTRKLLSNWYSNRDVQYIQFSSIPLKIWIRSNGDIELFKAIKNEKDDIFQWSKPKNQPLFMSRKYDLFEILLIVSDDNLGVLYAHKKKGLQGELSDHFTEK